MSFIDENSSRMKNDLFFFLTIVPRRCNNKNTRTITKYVCLDLRKNIVKSKCQPTRLKEKLAENPFVFLFFRNYECQQLYRRYTECSLGTDSVSSHQKDQECGRLIKLTKEMFLLVNMAAYGKEVCIPDGGGEESLWVFYGNKGC